MLFFPSNYGKLDVLINSVLIKKSVLGLTRVRSGGRLLSASYNHDFFFRTPVTTSADSYIGLLSAKAPFVLASRVNLA